MLDLIEEKFTQITAKCLERKAKEQDAEKKDMQLVFKLTDNEDGIDYLIYKQYKPIEVLTFLQVLGVKIDFKGYSLFVPKFIKGALNRFCEEESIIRDKVSVLSALDDKSNLVLWLYNGNQYVKQIPFRSLFNEEDAIIET